jgi:hypothetical protein
VTDRHAEENEVEPMSKIETVMALVDQDDCLLDDDALDAVSGGIGDEENFIKDEVNFGTRVVTMPFRARFLAEDH